MSGIHLHQNHNLEGTLTLNLGLSIIMIMVKKKYLLNPIKSKKGTMKNHGRRMLLILKKKRKNRLRKIKKESKMHFYIQCIQMAMVLMLIL